MMYSRLGNQPSLTRVSICSYTAPGTSTQIDLVFSLVPRVSLFCPLGVFSLEFFLAIGSSSSIIQPLHLHVMLSRPPNRLIIPRVGVSPHSPPGVPVQHQF